MIYWKANFQIPESGVQAAEVFVIVEDNEAVFYGDRALTNLLFKKQYSAPKNVDPYEYLLTLEEFANYSRV